MLEARELFLSADIAEAYVKYRPTFGPRVYDAIISFCRETGTSCDFSLAVDVGCGSGQSSVPLTKRFKEVIGLDVSQAQVDRAPKDIPNLSFRAGPAEDLSFLEDGSVDLVTAASALHFMDSGTLFNEVERVLKPGGAFVAYGYAYPTFDAPAAGEIFSYVYKDVLGAYWTSAQQHVIDGCAKYDLPFPGWRRHDNLTFDTNWTVDELMGFIHSWSATQKYLQANPEDDVLPAIRRRFKEAYESGDLDGREKSGMKITWPVFILMGHKPVENQQADI